ncbi:HlyD family secretion protein [Anaeroselena agilis]|uniref:Efflux RND transporter periplasmic adaptor subunit n=1 Tax=Anaeroselena agilis TaxID=3063788 RepID=A0ABU3P3P3_9FIRM|nr:efflux RND transporter periplasmic adaptor subunit [Selenomonadales bacterium 4137-cl]
MNKRLIIVGAVVFLALAAIAGYKLYMAREDGITATGTIEVTRADVMPKVNGYLGELKIEAGDTVKTGQVIARIARPDLEAQLLRDESALVKAKVQLEDLEKGARSQERRETAASLASAQAVYDKAKSDLERYRALYNSGAISAQQLDAAQSSYEVAQSALVAARSRLSLVEEGNRPDTIEAQRIEVKRSQAIVAASRALLADTVVASPISGVVLTKNFENGEYINPGSAIATIGDMNDCRVKVYIASTQLGLIKVGQPVDVRVDSFPGRIFPGAIKEISQNAEFTPRQSITQRERANLVFAVKVKVDNAEGILKPGMPADVVIK